MTTACRDENEGKKKRSLWEGRGAGAPSLSSLLRKLLSRMPPRSRGATQRRRKKRVRRGNSATPSITSKYFYYSLLFFFVLLGVGVFRGP